MTTLTIKRIDAIWDGVKGLYIISGKPTVTYEILLRHAFARAVEAELEIDELRADKLRIDWLGDPRQSIGDVTLPKECVRKHLDSLRDAIDCAMKMHPAIKGVKT